MNHEERIVCDPNVMLGKPIIKNTRITVEVILRKLSSGYTMDEITSMYQNITKDDILATIDYAASVIASEEMIESH
ncbi:MAG: DUF433 domain-containing protein [Bacteroidota bacterium]|nr:DUF433 domain-containing protein [Bacteroidota bacterium]